jgi:di/tricarboxylate transporter
MEKVKILEKTSIMDKVKPQGMSNISVIHLMISLFFMFIFGRICPTWSTVTRMGVQGISILIGAIWLISNRFGLVFTSFVGMFAVVASGYLTGNAILATTLGSDVVFQLILVFVFVYAISETGADAVLARWMISRKSLNGKPVLFSVVFMISITLLAAIVSSLGAFMFSVAMINSIAKATGYEEKSQWKKTMMTGAICTSSIGGAILPFKGLSLLIFNMFTVGIKASGIQINQVAYMGSALIAGLLFSLAFGLSVGPLFRVDFAKLREADVAAITREGGTKMNKAQVIVMLSFFVGFLYSIAMIWVPKTSPNYPMLAGVGQGFWFMIILVGLSLIHIDGKPIINIDQIIGKAVNWGIVFAVCLFTVVGMMIADKTVGIQSWLGNILAGVFGNMSFPVFMITLVLATILLTNFFSNTATAVIIGTLTAPFILQYATSAGINPNAVIPAVVMSASCAYLTMGAGGSSPLYLGLDCMKGENKWVWTYGLIALILEVGTTTGAFILCSYIM